MQYSHVLKSHVKAMAKNCVIEIKTAELTYLVSGGFVEEHSIF